MSRKKKQRQLLIAKKRKAKPAKVKAWPDGKVIHVDSRGVAVVSV